MKILKLLFCYLVVLISLNLHAQKEINTDYTEDSVRIDSVQLNSLDFMKKLTRFYEKNKNQLDQNSFIYIYFSKYNDKDSDLYFISLTLRSDFDNTLSVNYFSELGYCMYNNVLIMISYQGGNECLFFTQMKNKRTFAYKRTKMVKVKDGVNSPSMGFKVKKVDDNVFSIKKLYYFKHPSSKLRKKYYKIFYRHFY